MPSVTAAECLTRAELSRIKGCATLGLLIFSNSLASVLVLVESVSSSGVGSKAGHRGCSVFGSALINSWRHARDKKRILLDLDVIKPDSASLASLSEENKGVEAVGRR